MESVGGEMTSLVIDLLCLNGTIVPSEDNLTNTSFVSEPQDVMKNNKDNRWINLLKNILCNTGFSQ